MKVAFYKGVHSGLPGIYNRGVQIWTKSQYSHCELIFSDGRSASASYMDGGVRFKNDIDFNPEKWDFIELPDSFEKAALKWFEDHEHAKYDLLGNLHFVIGFVPDDKWKFFCSEAVAAALGIENAWRYDPGDLYPVIKRMSELLMEKPTLPLAA
jgi:hypothetical protein